MDSKFFKIKSIKLITNNPHRFDFLKKYIKVEKRIPIEDKITPFNKTLLLDEKKHLKYRVKMFPGEILGVSLIKLLENDKPLKCIICSKEGKESLFSRRV